MRQYLNLVEYVLEHGEREENRTGTDTISCFGCSYKVDLKKGYPLLTTKKMYFDSMLHEFFWYLSGEEHIKTLRKHTKIWDAWADAEGRLETSYARFWRRFPLPDTNFSADGELWENPWVKIDPVTGGPVVDQIAYIKDSLIELKTNPDSKHRRRLVVSAWHPANAIASKLPPCHYSFCFNVKGNKLNCHLTQRSGDLALGIPFNLACYSLLTMVLAKQCGYEPGEFMHSIVDLHIYENHVEGLKKQLQREPMSLPTLSIADKPLDSLCFDDVKLNNYQSHPKINFKVAV